jgi:hypothetical protein
MFRAHRSAIPGEVVSEERSIQTPSTTAIGKNYCQMLREARSVRWYSMKCECPARICAVTESLFPQTLRRFAGMEPYLLPWLQPG